LAIVMLAATAASADGLAWRAPATCPTVDEVRTRIERRLGDASLTEIGEVEVVVTSSPRGFSAEIDTRAISVAGRGRTLTATSCSELADAVAVVVSRLATEAKRARVAEVPPANDPVFAIAIAPPPRVAAVIAIPPRASRWGGGLRTLATSGIGVTPEVGLAGELAGFVRRDHTFGELGYARWAERTSFLTQGSPARVDVGVQMLAVRGGWMTPQLPLRAWVGLEIGSMSGRGLALDAARSGARRWTAGTAGVGVGWPFARLARLVGAIELAIPFERPRFVLADDSEIYEPSSASARCSLGFELGWR
jgi:hypothetical protein